MWCLCVSLFLKQLFFSEMTAHAEKHCCLLRHRAKAASVFSVIPFSWPVSALPGRERIDEVNVKSARCYLLVVLFCQASRTSQHWGAPSSQLWISCNQCSFTQLSPHIQKLVELAIKLESLSKWLLYASRLIFTLQMPETSSKAHVKYIPTFYVETLLKGTFLFSCVFFNVVELNRGCNQKYFRKY